MNFCRKCGIHRNKKRLDFVIQDLISKGILRKEDKGGRSTNYE